jgi:putative ABC transport system permease protein
VLPRWLRNLRQRRELERDLDAELAAHRDLLIDEHIKAGATFASARRAAQLEMGGLEVVKDGVRDVRASASLESWLRDVRYGLRQLRRAPLFAASVAITIGLGLGVFGSAFTILNAYVLRPVDLPNPYQLYALNWDTATERRHRFSLVDFEALRDNAPFFSGLIAEEEAPVMQDGNPAIGLLVTGNYFQVLGARAAMGRLLAPNDAIPAGGGAVVLSHAEWRSHYGADPTIIGREIVLGQQHVTVVGVAEPGFGLAGEELINFWAPLTMARAFKAADVWSDRDKPSLLVVARMREGSTKRQVRAWFDVWLRQRFPSSSESAPVAVYVESRATHIPLTGPIVTLLSLLVLAFALVLLIACANVTNLMLARAFGRQQEIAIRLSLGASRVRIVRQLLIESLTLAIPAAAVGLALVTVTVRVFPLFIVDTFPEGFGPVEQVMQPLDLDARVMAVLFVTALTSAVLVGLTPAVRLARANLVSASKGEGSLSGGGSRLRKGLVALQIGACVLFLVCATSLIDVSMRMANANTGLSYEHVLEALVAPPQLRAKVADRLRSDPAIERVAAVWRAPLSGPMSPIGVVASHTRIEQIAGFLVVSPDYFSLFGIRIVRGRPFTALEGDEGAAVALVSEATAHVLWPGLDPIDQTLDLVPARVRVSTGRRRPTYSSVRVIGVTSDVVSGMPADGFDKTCIYFATSVRSSDDLTMLVRGGADMTALKASVTAAVNAIEPDAPFQSIPIRTFVSGLLWIFQAFSAAASFLGVIGLLLAFSGTYAVVAFLVTRRTREFGVRLALGASPVRIVVAILAETLRTAVLGIGVGLMIAAALARIFIDTIPIIPKFSVLPYLVATAVVVMAAATAALIPSLRTARIDPSRALRVE